MIPKTVHYCWFGKKPLPESAKKCIDSWRKFLPGYQIKEWNEDNFDVGITAYTQQAYEAKKYAFVSDYARFWILYHHGGLYFDTDVELIRPIDDIIAKGPFMGREAGAFLSDMFPGRADGLAVAPGLGIGAEAAMPLFKSFLDLYGRLSFINEDGSLNTRTIVYNTSEVLLDYGLSGNDSGIECVGGVWIYPHDYFCPMDHTKGNYLRITDNTRSIHHYDASWVDQTAIHKVLAKVKKTIIRLIYTIRECLA